MSVPNFFAIRPWLLLIVSVTVTTLLTLSLVGWFAPQLLGIPVDLRLVRVAETVPPFFEGVFREQDYASSDFLVADPYVKRARPLYPDDSGKGPTDLLGFRNRSIPNIADVIVVGDSQTYGNNVVLEMNWPSQMREKLAATSPVLYSMAVGGWGPIEYLEIFPKALRFRPRVVVVAFYTGNDALDAFRLAYGRDRWASLRPDASLDASGGPEVVYPPRESDRWGISFDDGVATAFTPTLRYGANLDHPAIRAGYEILVTVGRRMGKLARDRDVGLIFTIIPSKELVYAKKVDREGITATPEYRALVAAESEWQGKLAAELATIPGAVYVDVTGRMQKAALQPVALYPVGIESHPSASGYGVIADAIASVVGELLPAKPEGVIAVPFEGAHQLYLARDQALWTIASYEILRQNGWQRDDVRVVTLRDIANFPYAGVVDRVDPVRFGPRR